MKTIATYGFAALALSLGTAAANAQYAYRVAPGPYRAPNGYVYSTPYGYGSPFVEGRSSYYPYPQWDRSGTAGRMGLGADPRYPEGPGNPRMGR
jgi:hypothetical protein